MSFPLTETEIAVRVYAHPLVQAYDRALSRLHARHTNAYGPDFMEPESETDNSAVRGIHRWTEQEQTVFNNLYRAARTIREDVRNKVSGK